VVLQGPSPRVSVVIPTYQRRNYVRRALASVLAQSSQDFELIVVDDGSTDGTGSAVDGLDDRIRYEWQENGGVSSARNAGIRLARGDLVAFLDSDDQWLPDHLAIVSDVLARHPEAVLCSTSPRFDAGGRQPSSRAEIADLLPLLFVENVVGAPSGLVVRRTALLEAGGFDERLPVMEGWELWLRLARLGPFALLRRRTFVFQATRGFLTERSSRSGDYQRAMDIVAASAATIAADSGRSDASDLRVGSRRRPRRRRSARRRVRTAGGALDRAAARREPSLPASLWARGPAPVVRRRGGPLARPACGHGPLSPLACACTRSSPGSWLDSRRAPARLAARGDATIRGAEHRSVRPPRASPHPEAEVPRP
jgi:glycosyl transferase family 2